MPRTPPAPRAYRHSRAALVLKMYGVRQREIAAAATPPVHPHTVSQWLAGIRTPPAELVDIVRRLGGQQCADELAPLVKVRERSDA